MFLRRRAACWLLLFAAPAFAQRGARNEKPVHIKTAGELQDALSRVDKLFAAEYAQDNLASVTAGIISGPNLVWTKSYGLADLGNQVSANKDSTYRIGSITKQFTAVMLLQLVAAGKVHLADPVAKFYPEIGNISNAYAYAPP